MGKSSKWFTKLLRRCRHRHRHRSTTNSPANATSNDTMMDANEHAIAFAAATAAVAEAAWAAANAAAEVVRLTSNPTGHVSRRWSHLNFAALKIQSGFRGYLARKALKALKGLVKLQALVRGHFVRKQNAEMLRRLQAMVRVQARARSTRVLNIESSLCSLGKETRRSHEIDGNREKLEDPPVLKRYGSNSSIIDLKDSEKTVSASNWVEVESSIKNSNLSKAPRADDEKNDKILEIDNWKPDSKPKSRIQNNHQPLRHISAQDYYNHSFAASDYLARYSPSNIHKSNVGPFTEDSASLKSLQFPLENTSPQVSSRTGSMRKSPAKTPSRDECSRSYLNGFATFASPSYMANTKSSRARSRSLSVPRQRGDDLEKVGSTKRSLRAFWESKNPTKRSLDASSNLSKQRW